MCLTKKIVKAEWQLDVEDVYQKSPGAAQTIRVIAAQPKRNHSGLVEVHYTGGFAFSPLCTGAQWRKAEMQSQWRYTGGAQWRKAITEEVQPPNTLIRQISTL